MWRLETLRNKTDKAGQFTQDKVGGDGDGLTFPAINNLLISPLPCPLHCWIGPGCVNRIQWDGLVSSIIMLLLRASSLANDKNPINPRRWNLRAYPWLQLFQLEETPSKYIANYSQQSPSRLQWIFSVSGVDFFWYSEIFLLTSLSSSVTSTRQKWTRVLK